MINKKQVCRHFGKMSKSYNDYAIVQKKMAYSLQGLSKKTGNFKRILEIGCGTGFFTQLLAETYPHAHIVATDISPDMLRVAQNTLSSFSNVSYEVQDGENLQLVGKFDLIISNAAFQWFQNYQQAFQHFYHLLQPGGYLLYATLGHDTFCELKTSFHAAHQALHITSPLHHGPTFISIDQLVKISQKIGFHTKHYEEFHKEYFPTTKDFLTSVKKIGANNAAHSTNMVINRNLMFSMIQYYEQHFTLQDQIYATYHTIYGCEQRPPLS